MQTKTSLFSFSQDTASSAIRSTGLVKSDLIMIPGGMLVMALCGWNTRTSEWSTKTCQSGAVASSLGCRMVARDIGARRIPERLTRCWSAWPMPVPSVSSPMSTSFYLSLQGLKFEHLIVSAGVYLKGALNLQLASTCSRTAR